MKQNAIKVLGIIVIFIIGTAATTNIGENRHFEIIKNIQIFTSLYKEVNTNYVDEIDPGEFMRTGLDAMMQSLDPYTVYYSEADIEGYRFITEGKYHGIGAGADVIGGYVTVTSVNKDTPADKAGIKVGDKILSVDGQNAKGKSMEDFNYIIKGAPGSSVKLVIERKGSSKPITKNVVREEVKVENVPYYGLLKDDIGYIALTKFTRQASNNVRHAFKELKKEKKDMKGLVLDLRGNGGGFLNEAVNICNIFIPKNELVVTTRGKIRDWDRSFRTTGDPTDLDIPIVILINKKSASASEIVSGVIQDYDRGVLIGQQSYGKGLVQNTMDLGYNAKVKVTTAKYYIPSQRCIQAVEYKNGEPVEIPDDERQKFETRNGRTVLDGGGIRPDIKIKSPANEGILKSLLDQHFIFDFVSEWAAQDREMPDNVEDFYFKEFNQFLSFIEKRNYDFDSDSDLLFKKLKKTAGKEGYNIDGSFNQLESALKAAKRNEVVNNEDAIIKMIEKEIAGRYYYENGKIRMGLRNDSEVKEAIKLIENPNEYNRILRGK